METVKVPAYMLAVYRQAVQEIRSSGNFVEIARLRRKDGNTSGKQTHMLIRELLETEVFPSAVSLLNSASEDKKHSSIENWLGELAMPGKDSKFFMESPELILDGIQALLASETMKKLDLKNDFKTFLILESLHDSRIIPSETFFAEQEKFLKNVLRFIEFEGEKSPHYPDAEQLASHGYLEKGDLDFALEKFHNRKSTGLPKFPQI